MSKGAKSHTYYTNLFITYYYDVLGPIFVCGFKTEVFKSTLERNKKEARKFMREHEVKVMVQISQIRRAFSVNLRDGAGTEVYIAVDKQRK